MRLCELLTTDTDSIMLVTGTAIPPTLPKDVNGRPCHLFKFTDSCCNLVSVVVTDVNKLAYI